MIYWLEQKTSCMLKVLPVCSHVVQCTRIAYPLICKSRAIHSYCPKAEPLVLSTDNEPMLSVTTDLFLSAFSFQQFFFRWPTFPQWKQLQFSLLSLVAFFDPLGLLDVLIARGWDFVVDACAANALDSATVINVCNRFSIVNSFASRLSVIHLLSSSDSTHCQTPATQVPLLPRSAHPAVQRYITRLSPTQFCIHVRE